VEGSKPAIREFRRSTCADASLRAEIKRVKQMTIEERIKAALSMENRFVWLNPVVLGK
jgi:hypothetical protein